MTERTRSTVEDTEPRAGTKASARGARNRFDALIENYPVFRALLRSVEEELISARGESLGQLVLDLGCGDGTFSRRALPNHQIIGVDPDLGALVEARAYGDTVVCGSATSLPFADDVFSGVLVNSVFEHIPDLESAVCESGRVLSPSGLLLSTSPNPRFSNHLFGSSLARSVGLKWLSESYARWFNGHSRHFHLLTGVEWQATLEKGELRLLESHDYISASAHRAFDLLHFLGLPTLGFRRLSGRWVPWRNPLTRWLACRLVRPLVDPNEDIDGTYTLVVAQAQSRADSRPPDPRD